MIANWTPTDWENARASYCYPAVRLVASEIYDNSGITFRSTVLVPDASRAQECTDFAIENYHHELLHGNETQLLTAVASVVFWGFFASADPLRKPNSNRALERARSTLEGRKDRRTDCSEITLDAASSAIQCCKKDDLENAIKNFQLIPNVGFSFASKLVMFALPQKATIYDSIIYNILREFSEHDEKFRKMTAKISPTASAKAPAAYAEWCHWCGLTANWLNDQGSRWHHRGEHYFWRPVDVERSLFQLGKKI